MSKSEQVQEIVKAYYPEGFDYHDEKAAVAVLSTVLEAAEIETLQKMRAILKRRGQVFVKGQDEYEAGKQAYATFVFNTIDRLVKEAKGGKR